MHAAIAVRQSLRAELVEQAGDYRWSGWSGAQGGEKEAMEGLCDVVGCRVSQWETRGKAAYRLWVSETRRQVRARKVKGGEEESADLDLMETIRAFSGGLAVGSEGFVEEVFGERRDLFGPRRERGARPLDGRGSFRFGAICALRDLGGRTAMEKVTDYP